MKTTADFTTQIDEIARRVREIAEIDETRSGDCEMLSEMLAGTDEYDQHSALEAVRTGWLSTDAHTRALARAIVLETAPELIADSPAGVERAHAEIITALSEGDEAYLCQRDGSVTLVTIETATMNRPDSVTYGLGDFSYRCQTLRISVID